MEPNCQQNTTSLENENLKREIYDQSLKIKRLENTLKEMEQKMKTAKVDFQSDKEVEFHKQQLEKFTYTIAHDLQEPVRTVKSFADLFAKKYASELGDEALLFLDYITNSSQKISDLINDLLNYSRIGKDSNTENINVNDSFINAQNSLNLFIKQDNVIIKNEGLPTLKGYKKDFKFLLLNLLDNALKFRKPEEELKISIKAIKKENFWEFSISDNGIGIEQNKLEDIFLVFRQLHHRNKYSGTGIGLAHCKKIVELHGGKIWATSEVGVGSTFYFTIPIVD